MDKPSALPPAPAPPGPGAELGAEPGAGGGGGHDHGPVRYRHPELRARARRNLLLALGLTAAVFLAEVAGGILSGSLALISDAGHMLADSMALGISLAALYLHVRPFSQYLHERLGGQIEDCGAGEVRVCERGAEAVVARTAKPAVAIVGESGASEAVMAVGGVE